ncbi:MAG: RNA 2',3'-cyclic phosphodiesterase [Methanobacteriota archaeon]|nr:MAG: RNA 2',3'-cyclic phosphodiesterase [Euryarchaeota archaeon]
MSKKFYVKALSAKRIYKKPIFILAMRAFIACEVFHEGVGEVVEEIKKTGADIKFVEAENTHVTLKFLGEIGDAAVEEVGRALEESCAGMPPMVARLTGLGAFPNTGYVRVLWIGVICPEMEGLQRRLDDALSRIGFRREKGFKMHLTIGRVRSARNKERLVEALRRRRDMEIGSVTIDAVKLKKSELTPKGPVYTDLKEVRLC